MQPVVTVGLDGSRESLAAAHWAAREALLRKLPLRLFHAWIMLPPAAPGVPERDVQSYWARRILREAEKELYERHPGLAITAELAAKETTDGLLSEADNVELLVLGSRGVGAFENFFVGDVSLQVVGRANRPVVLVRAQERRDARTPRGETGDVVVGLNLRRPSGTVLEFAFDSAARRGCGLRAVHGRSLPLHAHVPWGVAPDTAEALVDELRQPVSDALRPWREKFPGVRVTEDIVLESPARAVVRAASDAALLVVGRRLHHRAATPRIGPVAHAAIHHAACPVAIVPG